MSSVVLHEYNKMKDFDECICYWYGDYIDTSGMKGDYCKASTTVKYTRYNDSTLYDGEIYAPSVKSILTTRSQSTCSDFVNLVQTKKNFTCYMNSGGNGVTNKSFGKLGSWIAFMVLSCIFFSIFLCIVCVVICNRI